MINKEDDGLILTDKVTAETKKTQKKKFIRNKMAATSDSKAPVRQVKRVQFGILSADEIVSSVI